MILIADSGSFKTNWRILKDAGRVEAFNTIGLNPYFTGSEEIQQEIKAHFPREILMEQIREVHFYGSGCGAAEKGKMVENSLSELFSKAKVSVNTDLLASARACFGKKQGIVLILGTGSNNGLYDGEKITRQIPSLGYVLGDEGSGSQLGKKLLKACLMGELPEDLQESFLHRYNMGREEILDKLYSKPRPNKFLASFTPFLWWHRQHGYVQDIITESFSGLIQHCLKKYPEFYSVPVRCTGSVAHFFSQEITSMVSAAGGRVDCILQHPADALAEYHLKYH